jgi:aerotaxis receptor
MRSNFPVYDEEHELQDGESIVSKTDLKGRITYVNPAFLRISGFSEEELLGKAHNIVRHPDMPEEAFADLWQVLKTGHPWTGLVKNRRKDGGYYWVIANVAPIKENGEITGFMSVRTKPSRSQIESAATFYAKIKGGQAEGWTVSHGVPERTGWRGLLAKIFKLSHTSRISIAMGSLIALFGMNLLVSQASAAPMFINLAGMALTAAAWFGLQASLAGKLQRTTESLNALVGGDLSQKPAVDGSAEVKLLQQSLYQLFINLQASVGDVRSNIVSMVESTKEIADGNLDLAMRTESQAANLRQTTVSIKEFSQGVKQNAVNAHRADEMAREAAAVALRGGEAVAEVGATMNDIHASAGKIRDIITLINEIAFQTNLLALNAAVEAARAGEQGRGFAVVAGEVRNLAQKSAAAASQIHQLIDESSSRIETGHQLVQHAGTTVKDIAAAIGKVTELMGDISTACHQQDKGIDQVNQALDELDQVTQQNAALVEQAAAAAACLNEEAEQAQLAVSVFKIRSAGGRHVHLPIPGKSAILPATPAPALLRAQRTGKPANAPIILASSKVGSRRA